MPLKLSNPALRFVLPDCDRVELVEPLVVEHELGRFEVPAGFRNDLESVPVWVSALMALAFCWWPSVAAGFQKLGRGSIPGELHDYLYFSGVVSRPVADALYLEAMHQFGVPALARWTKYLVLRCVGGVAWREHRRLGHRAQTFGP